MIRRQLSRAPSRARRAFAAVMWLAACLAPGIAAATTWVVNTTSDAGGATCPGACSLRNAIAIAASNDAITFNPALNGIAIQLSGGELAIADKNLAITGNGANLTVINANNASRVFNIASTGTMATMTVNISGVTMTAGRAGISSSGGALYISKPNGNTTTLNVNLDGDVVSNSRAGDSTSTTYTQGGGIYSQRAILRITNSTISGNTSYGPSANGGGILATGSYANGTDALAGNTLVIINSTISGNSVSGSGVTTGGGVEFAFGSVTILNTTIDSNSAVRGANLHNGNASTTGFPFTLRNSIVADASPGAGATGPNIGGPISDAQYDLIDNDASVTYTGIKTGVITATNAQLGGLGDNGGPTPTMVPATASPAINAGDPAGCKDDGGIALTTDQRGSARPIGGGCDLGAYERFDLAVTPASLPAANVNVPYSTAVSVTASQGAVTYAITGGSIAPFALNPNTGAITGNTTVAGTLNFTVTATDSLKNKGSRTYAIVINGGPATTLVVDSFPSPTTAGVAHNFKVTAKDTYGNVANLYTGNVNLSSSDAQASLPSPYTFVAGDNGVHMFSATLKTVGMQSITATDAANSLNGTQGSIVVMPAAAASMTLDGYPSSVVAGSPAQATLTMRDAWGNVATGYTGTVHFTSSDGNAMLPADYTFTAADAGLHSFNVTLKTAGTQSITAQDTGNASLTSTQSGIVVVPAPVAMFVVNGYPSPITAGISGNFSVTAKDVYGNVATNYAGTAHFTSSDGSATLPADSTLTNGSGTFSATLKTAGTQSISATDTATSATGSQPGIVVSPAAANTLVVAGYPSSVTAATSNGFSVIAKDMFGNTATGYAGTVHFTSSDGNATLPSDAVLANGTGAFNATLKTAGTQSLTATDTVASSIAGTQSGIVVNPGAAANFVVNAYPSPTTAGVAHSFTVTTKDASGNTATGYAGSVHFTSSDGAAVLPADSSLTNGTGTFSATLKTAGAQSLTATDTATSSITGTQSGIVVDAAAFSALSVTGYPSQVVAGTSNGFSVAAKDAYGNSITGYTGTVHFTGSDAQAMLPPDYTFITGDNGVHAFSATLKTAGTQSLTATDASASVTGTQSGIVVNPAAANTLVVAGYPSPVTAGTSNGFTLTAKDAFGNVATGYSGSVNFTSSDAQATLPSNYAFTPADNGVHAFNATLNTAGAQSLTATDTVTSTLTGTQSGIVVNPGATTSFVVAAYPSPTTAGAAHNFTVTAKDASGNVATGYAGSVHFTSSDGAAVLPADASLTNGTGTFSATLKTAGTQSLTATDAVNNAIAGTQGGIVVNAAAATSLTLAGYPSPITAGTSNSFNVTVKDAFGNVASGYTGSVHFTGSDAQATLPADYTFTAGDNGVHTFNTTLKTAGTQSLTATDTVNATLTSTQSGIVVDAAAASRLIVDGYPSPARKGMSNPFTVTAQDAFGNTATSYAGTVHFTSSDALATLPADYAFVAGDNGTHGFNATFGTAGAQSLTATDTATSSITGTQSGIVVKTQYTITASVNGSNGTLSPTSQTIDEGTTATVTMFPAGGYHPTIDPSTTCTGGTLVGNSWSSSTISADCTLIIAFAANPLPSFAITIDDSRTYVRYGKLINYVVTVTNNGPGDATAGTVAAALPAQIDVANTHWSCFGAGAGASCVASGDGALNDSSVAIPAGRSLTWLITAPVLPNADGGSVDTTVSVNGDGATASATDSDILVIFRDGFDVPYGDGTGSIDPMLSTTAANCPANPAPATLDDNNLRVFALPAAPAAAAVDVVLAARGNGHEQFRAERLNLDTTPRVRLVALAADGRERASAWASASAGARLAIATAQAADGSTSLLLEGATESLSISLPATAPSLLIQTQAAADGACD